MYHNYGSYDARDAYGEFEHRKAWHESHDVGYWNDELESKAADICARGGRAKVYYGDGWSDRDSLLVYVDGCGWVTV